MTQSILLALIPAALLASPADSLRTETIKGKIWIIHQVDPGETLYALSRRYGVEVPLISEANPETNAGLRVGQIIRVPAKAASSPVRKATNKIHIVAEKETLFSLSKQYQVTVSDLLRWNNLSTNELKIGQRLLVAPPGAPDTTPADHPSGLTHRVQSETEVIPESKSDRKTDQHSSEQISPLPADASLETGLATLMEGNTEPRKYLAWHKTIPYGTVVRIRNKDTREELFVRVIGVPSDHESKSLIKLSRAAWEKLGGKDPLHVEVIWFR